MDPLRSEYPFQLELQQETASTGSKFFCFLHVRKAFLSSAPRYSRMTKYRAIEDRQAHSVATGWTDALLICRKCSRKLDGGFGEDGKETLRRALRGALRASGQRGQIGLIEVACLGVCPKRAVTTARASQPGSLLIVPEGMPVDRLLQPASAAA